MEKEGLCSYTVPADNKEEGGAKKSKSGFASAMAYVILAALIVAPWFAIANLDSKVERILDMTDPIRQMSIKVGDKAPDGKMVPFEFLSSRDDSGKETLFSEATKGKTTLLVFWSPYCGVCVPKLAEIAELRKTYSDEKVAIVALTNQNMKAPEEKNAREQFLTQFPEETQSALKKAETTVPLFVETPDEKGRTMGMLWEIRSVPFFAVMDKDGKIMEMSIGDMAPAAKMLKKLAR